MISTNYNAFLIRSKIYLKHCYNLNITFYEVLFLIFSRKFNNKKIGLLKVRFWSFQVFREDIDLSSFMISLEGMKISTGSKICAPPLSEISRKLQKILFTRLKSSDITVTELTYLCKL